MNIPLQFILYTYIVYFGLEFAQSYNQIVDQFQNVFNSFLENDSKKGSVFSKYLKNELSRKQKVFDTMKEELQIAQSINVDKKKNFLERSRTNESIESNKRDTNKQNYNHGILFSSVTKTGVVSEPSYNREKRSDTEEKSNAASKQVDDKNVGKLDNKSRVDEKKGNVLYNNKRYGDKPYIPYSASYCREETYESFGKSTTRPLDNQENTISSIYLFSSNLQSDVINASYGLLLSQREHLRNVTKQFDVIDERTNIFELKKIDSSLFSLEAVIRKELKSLEYMNENPDKLSSEEKVDPIEEVSMVCLLSSWTHILNLINHIKIDNKTAGVEKQIEKMKKTIDIASVELRLYERYQEERLVHEEKINKQE